ncbi:hypothetical protein OQA88_4323 [Cercophora sp. LCS_1]
MEVAGLAIGVIGLAGAFKDIIDLFALFTASRDIDRDYGLLEAKHDLEKTTLLQWAESVRLLAVDYDKHLDDPNIPLHNTLLCLRLLLSDASKLKQKYGLIEAPAQSLLGGTRDVTSNVSAPFVDKFARDFAAFQIRTRQEKPSVGARFKWAIQEKGKFEALVKNLGYFISKLKELVPPLPAEPMGRHPALKRPGSPGDPALECQGPKRLKPVTDSRVKIDAKISAHILQCIRFSSMDDRRLSVRSAHTNTLRWSLEPPNGTTRPWSDLAEWLRSGSGIYWVCGKAGSGKSTLMHYLYDHGKTRAYLAEWADGAELLVGNHFFWNLGTSEQKSQSGLKRCILHQVLGRWPSLIPVLLPRIYKDALRSCEQWQWERRVDPPSYVEIGSAFHQLQRVSLLGKVCLLIDGMDEYDGTYTDGIELIQGLSTNPNVKIMVSSRPIPECVDAFSHLPQLQLHDLMKGDIRSYVRDTIGGHPYLLKLRKRYHLEVDQILNDLVDKSSGVFLWVVLACRSLLTGFADCDRVSGLRGLVNELPEELQDMFAKMLRRIKRQHRAQGAKMLSMMYKIKAGESYLLACGMIAMDQNLTGITVDVPKEFDDYEEALAELGGRLRSRTGGLIELRSKRRYLDPARNYHSARIEFMHELVFEFLDDAGTWETECLAFDDPDFVTESAISLCHFATA